jgi:coenzyme Q-binding protein COQ10
MPRFTDKRRVRHAASDMFDLVADVERYPEFVPLCRDLKIRRRIQQPEGVEVIVADMTVAYKLVRERFSSRVTLDRPNLQILVEYLEGPFSHLENRWTFHAVGERVCDVEFFISYEFRSRTLGLLMGGMFDLAFRRFAHAFEQRADRIHPRVSRA